uniref:SCO7613 C-terminal domain-containing membrane protein n=1 Tax=Nocardiopsis halotolerans TaxID=124252 RepID=UPI0005928013
LVTVSAGGRLGLVAVALAVVGVIALATAVRPDRRWAAPVGGLLMLAALWTVLSAWNVDVPEAYTVPPALAGLAVGWEWSRRAAEPPSSWAAYGGGLA